MNEKVQSLNSMRTQSSLDVLRTYLLIVASSGGRMNEKTQSLHSQNNRIQNFFYAFPSDEMTLHKTTGLSKSFFH